MKIRDLFLLAGSNLTRRKLRTILTILGVVIGCTSIVIMVSLGEAQNRQMDEMVDQFDLLTAIHVNPTNFHDPMTNTRPPRTGVITDREVKVLENIAGVDYVDATKTLSQGSQVEIDKKYLLSASFGGINPEQFEERGIELVQGRMYNPKMKRDSIEVIASDSLGLMIYPIDYERMEAMPDIDPMESRFRLTIGDIYSQAGPIPQVDGMEGVGGKSKTYKLDVVGIYKTEGMPFSSPGLLTSSENIEILRKESQDLMAVQAPGQQSSKKDQAYYYESVTIYALSPEVIPSIIQEVEKMDLQAHSDSEAVDQIKQFGLIAQLVLGGIGAVSMLVAAIGIANTMIMSIYERTKEIGVMKVIGASVSDIRNMFLVEAAMIGLLGGIAGLIISFGLSNFLNSLATAFMQGSMDLGMDTVPKISIITPQVAILALIFCFFIGLVTGYLPARKATQISAIEAIRTE